MSVNIVKSVGRTFDIFRLFKLRSEAMTAIEISRELQLPLTSTHSILKSLHALGYLDYNRESWSYVPSSELPALFDWVQDRVEDEGQLKRFLEQLNLETRETISLSRQSEIEAKIVFGLETVHPIGVRVSEDYSMPITNTLTGIAMLSALDDQALEAVLLRVSKEDPAQWETLDRPALDFDLSRVRDEGIIAKYDGLVAGVGAICTPIYSPVSKQKLVVGVVGPSERIAKNAEIHRKTIAKLLRAYNIKSVFPIRR